MRRTRWSDFKLSYLQPAEHWTEALPVGNGRLGAMVFGGVTIERLQLNEDTFWSGGPRNWNNPHAREALPLVRQALFAGRYLDTDALCKQMQGPYNQSYLPMGNLFLAFEHTGKASEYSRQLDLDRALASTQYRVGDAVFTRQTFASFPDQVIVIHLSCDQPGQISFSAWLDSLLHYQVKTPAADRLVLKGTAPSHVEPSYRNVESAVVYSPDEGMTYEIHMQAIHHSGKVWAEDGRLNIRGADRVTLLLSAATSFNGYDKSPRREGKDPSIQALTHLHSALGKTYTQLRKAHIDDHCRLFRRVRLDLGLTSAVLQPTDQRLKAFHEQRDLHLVNLIFQIGRYLMIACSRPGTQPANLQGIWNDQLRPPWSSNYTTNINTEMNYWPVETCNLAECHQPLFDLLCGLAVTGSQTARVGWYTTMSTYGGIPGRWEPTARAARTGPIGPWPGRGCASTCGSTTPSTATGHSCWTPPGC
jgi:alpha-L-fucosidase 2